MTHVYWDSLDQTDLPGGSLIWGRPTIILLARDVKCPPVHAIPLLSRRNYLLASLEYSESPCLGRSSSLGRPICAGQPPCSRQCSPSHNRLPWHRAKLANPFHYSSQHLLAHQRLSQLEHQFPGVAYQPSASLDHPGLNTGQ